MYDGTRLLGTVPVNQKQAPNDFSDQGFFWTSLILPTNGGIFQITGTKLVVKLTDKADGTVIADAVRIERVDASVTAPASGLTNALKQSSTVADAPIVMRTDLAWAVFYELESNAWYPESLFSTNATRGSRLYGPWPTDEDDSHAIDTVFASLVCPREIPGESLPQ